MAAMREGMNFGGDDRVTLRSQLVHHRGSDDVRSQYKEFLYDWAIVMFV